MSDTAGGPQGLLARGALLQLRSWLRSRRQRDVALVRAASRRRAPAPVRTIALAGAFTLLVAVGATSVVSMHASAADQTVTMAGLQFTPPVLSITTGTTVTWDNKEATNYPVLIGVHNIVSDDNAFSPSPPINPGQSWSYTFNKAGTYGYHCGIHPEMKGTITVTGPDKQPGGGTPKAPGGTQASAPRAASTGGGKVRTYDLTISERTMNVLGVPMQWWTFNGTVPGTILRANVGDTLKVVLHNATSVPHSFHNHLSDYTIGNDGSSMTAPLPVVPHQNDDVVGAVSGAVPGTYQNGGGPKVGQNPIGPYDPRGDNDVAGPGQTRTYTYKLTDAGSYFYHCHVFEATDHIEKGLFGAIIVYPKGWTWQELPKDPSNGNTKAWVTNELGQRLFEDVVIISERMPDPGVNLPTDSMIGMAANGGAAGAGISVANGRAWNDPYIIGPVRSGQRVLLHVGNIGESPHAWHLHAVHFWRLNQESADGMGTKPGWFTAPIESRNNMGLFPGDLVPTVFTAGQPGFWFGHDHVVPDAYLGMVPWLQVLPADTSHPASTRTGGGTSPQQVAVKIVEPSSSDPNSWGYSPASVTVPQGSTLTWTNAGSQTHSVVSDDGTPESFDSGDLAAKGTWSRTFNKPGTYAYHCRQHPWMKGTVVVGSSSGSGGAAGAGSTSGGASSHRTTSRPASTSSSGMSGMSSGSRGGSSQPVGPARSSSASGKPSTYQAHILEGSQGNPQSWVYQPAALTVHVGDTVVWTNDGKLPHTVTSTGDSLLSSGRMGTGARWRFTFTRTGTFAYICAYHPWMKGTVTVLPRAASAVQAPPPASSGSGAAQSGDAAGAPERPADAQQQFAPAADHGPISPGFWVAALLLPVAIGSAVVATKLRSPSGQAREG